MQYFYLRGIYNTVFYLYVVNDFDTYVQENAVFHFPNQTTCQRPVCKPVMTTGGTFVSRNIIAAILVIIN